MSRDAGFGDDDRLPWLETVEEDYREGPSVGRIALLIALLLLVAAAAVGGYYWYQQQQGLGGSGQLIQAPEGDYKIKPDEPGGRVVDGEGDTVFTTSQGAASNSSINTDALPEAPVDGRTAARAAASDGSKTAKMTVPSSGIPVPVRPAAAPAAAPAATGSGSLVQLGAFPSEGGANTAWSQMSKRFAYLAPLGKSVERGEKDGKAVFRLRVNAGSNSQAREICGKLKIAGENCYVTN